MAYFHDTKSKMKTVKENRLKQEAEAITDALPDDQRVAFKGAQEKGASIWLSALPLKALGYSLNKQEFRDAIKLRYAWVISDMPRYCACGLPSSVDHTLTCKKGGYVGLRHNRLRDTEALLMKEVTKDVQRAYVAASGGKCSTSTRDHEKCTSEVGFICKRST